MSSPTLPSSCRHLPTVRGAPSRRARSSHHRRRTSGSSSSATRCSVRSSPTTSTRVPRAARGRAGRGARVGRERGRSRRASRSRSARARVASRQGRGPRPAGARSRRSWPTRRSRDRRGVPRRRLGVGARLRACASSEPTSRTRWPAPAGTTTRPGCRSLPDDAGSAAPRYDVDEAGPTTPSVFTARVTLGVAGLGEGRALEEAGRAGRGAGRVRRRSVERAEGRLADDA